jgi:hypothetical protein
MKENGIDPKLVAMDHAASYRAIKNGNVKNFLAMTPIMSDINAIKSTFDRRSQLNLRRMQNAITNGDNASYKKFLKNQKELEGVWKTMTGSQSSLGKIRIGATGNKKGVTKIFDYGATSILDKNKNLLNELGDNLVIRENIVKASTQGNLDEVSRIMLEGSEAEKPRASKLPESFKNLNKPEMFKTENQIRTLLADLGCPKSLQKASGGRIKYSKGSSCAIKGQQKLNLGLTNGFDKTEGELAKKILQAGRGMGSMFALRNILGPTAVGFTVAAEAGLVGYDMLSKGKSFKEAVGDSLFNYALGDKTQIDNKKLRYQGYKDAGVDANQIGKISAYENAIDEMNNTFGEFNEENRLYNIAVNQKGKGRIPEQRFQKIKQQQAENFYNQADKNKALIQDLAKTQTEDKLDKAIDPMVPALMSDADAKRKAMQMTKPSTVAFGNFMDTVFPKGFLSDTTFKEDRDKAVNYMPAVQEYHRGNQFAGGGIAGLSGGDPEGAMTRSMNPDSQGLSYLFNRVKKV